MIFTAALDKNGNQVEQTATASLYYCIDSPASAQTRLLYPGSVTITGWVASVNQSTATITVALSDGRQLTPIPDLPRPDVVAHFQAQGSECNEKCGFSFELEINSLRELPLILSIVFANDETVSEPYELSIAPFVSMQRDNDGSIADNSVIRADYKSAWNAIAETEDDAKLAVAGYTDEDQFQATAIENLKLLQETVGILAQDHVLEIGCGVARLAPVLSPVCQHWTGVDVSENMIEHARRRTAALDNVSLITSNGWDLQQVPDESQDVVYCLVVFMHLDEWERYNYVCEAKRVLRPGGRLLINNFNLLSADGWRFFMDHLVDYHPLKRPSNVSKSSTPQELVCYLQQSGFDDIQTTPTKSMFVEAWGRKP